MAEIYLKRKIDNYLVQWKNDTEWKPLIVKGARQVGKTESIRRFAEENYKFEEFLWAKGATVIRILSMV